MSYAIVPTEPEHIKLLATRLREDDVTELEAAGQTPQKALWRSYRQSSRSKTAFIDGEIAATWGVGGCPLGKVGRPWLLTAPPIEHARIAFLREGRYEVAEMLMTFEELRGFVDGRYHRALCLLDALGFSLSAEFPFGPYNVPFRQYSIRRA